MLSMKIEGNSVIYVFEKELAEQAKQLYPLVAAKVLGVISNNFNPLNQIEVSKGKTLDSISKKIGGSEVKLKLNTTKTPKAGLDDLYRQKTEITCLVSELCPKYGLGRGAAFKKAYRILQSRGGYDVYEKGPHKLKGEKDKTLVSRIVSDGKGLQLIQLLSNIVD